MFLVSLSPNVEGPYTPFLYYTRTIETSRLDILGFYKFLNNLIVEREASNLEEHYTWTTEDQLKQICLPGNMEFNENVIEARKWALSEYGYYESRDVKDSWCPVFNNAGMRWFWVAELMTVHLKDTNQIFVYKYELFNEG